MATIVFSLNNSEDYLEIDDNPASTTAFPELKQIKEKWKSLLNQYTNIRGIQAVAFTPEWVQVDFEPLPTQNVYTYQFQLDHTFFDQLIIAYAQNGWEVVSLLYSTALDHNNMPRITPAGQVLVHSSVRLLMDMVFETLSNLETDLTKFAQSKWEKSIEKLREYQSKFEKKSKSVFKLKNRQLASELFELVKNYDAISKKIESLQNDRAKVDRDGKYIPGKNDSEHMDMYRTFGATELKLIAERLEIAKIIFGKFPPAVFVLDELQGFIRKADVKSYKGVILSTSYNQSELEDRIYKKLLDSIYGLRDLNKEIEKSNQLSSLDKQNVDAAIGVESLIAKNSIDTFEKQIKAFETISSLVALGQLLIPIAIMEWDLIRGLDKNPVMGFQSLVQEYWQQLLKNDPKSWRRVVFQSYQNKLLAELNYQELINKKISLVIKLIKFVEAVVSILGMIVSVIASEGATLPWAVSVVCTVLETANSVMTIALLSVMTVELKLGNDENQKLWRESLLLLSFEEIDTVRSVGVVLNRIELYRISISLEIVKMLVKSKLAKLNTSLVEKYSLPDELDLVRRAIDLENLAGDLDTLILDNGLLVKPKDE